MASRQARTLLALSFLLSACSRVPVTPVAQVPAELMGARIVPNIFVVVFENHSYEQIIGNARAPYINALAKRYALATNYRGVTHPSLPNYLALTGGSTFGITSDCTSCSVNAPNLGDQLDAKRIGWKIYAEGLPQPCSQVSSSGRYAKKHDPFLYFKSIASDLARCRAHVVPLSSLTHDASAGTIPSFSMIVPDGCHDMHDCTVATGDSWLKSFVAGLVKTAAWKNNGLLAVTFDEDDFSKVNRVVTVLVTSKLRSGIVSSKAFNHYSLLRAIEDAYGLAPLQNARTATNIFKAFNL